MLTIRIADSGLAGCRSKIDTVKGLMVSEHLAEGCLLTGAH